MGKGNSKEMFNAGYKHAKKDMRNDTYSGMDTVTNTLQKEGFSREEIQEYWNGYESFLDENEVDN